MLLNLDTINFFNSPYSPTNMQQWQYPHRQISGGLFFQATSVKQRNKSLSCLTIHDALFENHHTLSKNQIKNMLNNAIIILIIITPFIGSLKRFILVVLWSCVSKIEWYFFLDKKVTPGIKKEMNNCLYIGTYNLTTNTVQVIQNMWIVWR